MNRGIRKRGAGRGSGHVFSCIFKKGWKRVRTRKVKAKRKGKKGKAWGKKERKEMCKLGDKEGRMLA